MNFTIFRRDPSTFWRKESTRTEFCLAPLYPTAFETLPPCPIMQATSCSTHTQNRHIQFGSAPTTSTDPLSTRHRPTIACTSHTPVYFIGGNCCCPAATSTSEGTCLVYVYTCTKGPAATPTTTARAQPHTPPPPPTRAMTRKTTLQQCRRLVRLHVCVCVFFAPFKLASAITFRWIYTFGAYCYTFRNHFGEVLCIYGVYDETYQPGSHRRGKHGVFFFNL